MNPIDSFTHMRDLVDIAEQCGAVALTDSNSAWKSTITFPHNN
jgi:hypothetical protein